MKLESRLPGPWALPRLSVGIPTRVREKGRHSSSRIAIDLATTLLELGIATQADIDISADAEILARRVMTRWWNERASNLSFFAWTPSIRSGHEFWAGDDNAYFCVGPRSEQVPHYQISRAIEQLEEECPGFGQTVLALLDDAAKYLPFNLPPSGVLQLARWFYWQGEFDEYAYAKAEVKMGYHDEKTAEEFLKRNEVFTRAEFFANIPDWLPSPERVCSRADAAAAAKSQLALEVIAACDAITAYAARPQFKAHASRNAFAIDAGIDVVGAAFALSWNDSDCTIRTIDDTFSMFMEGDSTDQLAIASIDLDPKKFKRRLLAMEEGLGLARLVGDLILLIGDPQ